MGGWGFLNVILKEFFNINKIVGGRVGREYINIL